MHACHSHTWIAAGERRKRGKTDRRSTELSTIIRNCLEQTILLELMPSSQIDVYVQVLQVKFVVNTEHLHCTVVTCIAITSLQESNWATNAACPNCAKTVKALHTG